jgi:hypothetical protein
MPSVQLVTLFVVPRRLWLVVVGLFILSSRAGYVFWFRYSLSRQPTRVLGVQVKVRKGLARLSATCSFWLGRLASLAVP